MASIDDDFVQIPVIPRRQGADHHLRRFIVAIRFFIDVVDVVQYLGFVSGEGVLRLYILSTRLSWTPQHSYLGVNLKMSKLRLKHQCTKVPRRGAPRQRINPSYHACSKPACSVSHTSVRGASQCSATPPTKASHWLTPSSVTFSGSGT